MKSLYAMQLHEIITVDGHTEVLRVPGGWIYEIYDGGSNISQMVFVPFNNEFMGKPEPTPRPSSGDKPY